MNADDIFYSQLFFFAKRNVLFVLRQAVNVTGFFKHILKVFYIERRNVAFKNA
jgi:hypothetical protein